MTSQLVALLIDIFLLPIFKIGFTSAVLFLFCPTLKHQPPSVFVHDKKHAELKKAAESLPEMDDVINNLIKLPDDVKNSETAKMCKLTGKQRQDMMVTMLKLITTVVKVISFNLIGTVDYLTWSTGSRSFLTSIII